MNSERQHSSSDESRQDGARHISGNLYLKRYTMTVEDAASVFTGAGFPRSVRTISRYCANKNLDCHLLDLELTRKYVIDPKSVDTRLAEIRQIMEIRQQSSGDKTRQDMASHDRSREAMTGHMASGDEQEQQGEKGTETEINKLKAKVESQGIDLRVAKGLQEEFIRERQTFINQISSQGEKIGKLEERLLQLEAPKEKVHEVEEVSPGGDNSPVEEQQ